jgi:hypothetical protein
MSDSAVPSRPTTTALYHPAPLWLPDSRVKTLLLFFDKVALLALDEKHDAESTANTEALADLFEHGLIEVVNPQQLLDVPTKDAVLTALRDEAVWQALDPIGRDEHFYYGHRVFATLNGPEPSLEMMTMRNELMRQLGVGTDYRENDSDGSTLIPTYREKDQAPSVPIHTRLWAPILSSLALILRRAARSSGVDLHPVTDQVATAQSLDALFRLPGMPSTKRVVRLELENVGVDLSGLPLTDVLAFRESHGAAYRDYAQRLAALSGELALSAAEERTDRLIAAREELGRAADELRAVARKAWHQPLPTFAIGLLGAAWNTQERSAAPLGALADALQTEAGGSVQSCHTYVFHSASVI